MLKRWKHLRAKRTGIISQNVDGVQDKIWCE